MSGWSVPGLAVWGGRPVVRCCGDIASRHRAVLDGIVSSLASGRGLDGLPRVDAELLDGTGSVVLRWLGRTAIAGVEPGCRLRVEGTVVAHRGQLLILNPLFLLRSAADRAETGRRVRDRDRRPPAPGRAGPDEAGSAPERSTVRGAAHGAAVPGTRSAPGDASASSASW